MTDKIRNVRYTLPQGGSSPLGQTIWGPFHIISVINHQSSIISHQSSIINHQSSMINDQSIVSTHQSSIFSRHAVITFFLTCMQRRGHSLGTFGHHRRPSGILGNHRKHSVNPRQLSETVGNLHFDRFFTRFRHQIGQIWSYRGIHTTNRCEISRSIDSEGGQRLVFDIWW